MSIRFPGWWKTLLLLIPVAAAGVQGPGELRFLNGDQLYGSVIGIESGRLLVSLPWEDMPLKVPARYVGMMVEPDRDQEQRSSLPVPSARMTLVNDDKLELNSFSLEDEEYQVTTVWGGELVFPRTMVKELTLLEPDARIVIDGVGPLRDWEIPEVPNLNLPPPHPIPHGVQFNARSSMKRRMPDNLSRFILEYTVTLPEHHYHLQVSLDGQPGGRQTNAPNLTLTHSPNRMNFNAVQNTGRGQANNRANWMVQLPDLPHQLHVRWYVDRVDANFGLQVNGQWIHLWDLADFDFRGGRERPWLTLRYQHGTSPAQFTHLRVFSWNGVLPEEVHLDDDDFQAEAERVILRNGDVLTGRVIGLDEAFLHIRTPEQPELRVPIRQVSRIRGATALANKPKLDRRDVRVYFESGSNMLTLRLLDITENHVSGEIAGVGEPFQIARSHIRYVQFNPYTVNRWDRSLRNWPDLGFSLPTAE